MFLISGKVGKTIVICKTRPQPSNILSITEPFLKNVVLSQTVADDASEYQIPINQLFNLLLLFSKCVV
ncbi:hypothetical protein MWQ_06856 [Acinetobacter seifertii]|nr:hypothetical protein MWQ_06856 [Acinetobacter seifertii]